MHPMVKHLVNCITDDKPIDWDAVNKELDRITISQKEKLLCQHLRTIHTVMTVHKECGCESEGTNQKA